MKAIDLYSGIGGWTLGFRQAGIEVVMSFEWLPISNKTYEHNHGRAPVQKDIRTLGPSDLPEPGSIDIVVGSPPCTQFSFANRGGSGDIADGLVDIKKFFECVRYLKPKYWVMENVPRVSQIVEEQIKPGGALEEYADLVATNVVVDASEWGLPQRRNRVLIGYFPIALMKSYRSVSKPINLSNVLSGLDSEMPYDCLYDFHLSQEELTDHVFEEPLTAEEVRMNRDAKSYNPVYNKMAFPDLLNRPSRTITSTCTRVSRESIVVPDKEPGMYRRLSLREKACLQGFPISFQFLGTYNDRAKMIGNAIPPLLTFMIGSACKEIPANLIKPLGARQNTIPRPLISRSVIPDTKSSKYRESRSFKAALPGFRFGSGVRFELANSEKNSYGDQLWRFAFYYGNSKKIKKADLSPSRISNTLASYYLEHLITDVKSELRNLLFALKPNMSIELQKAWTAQGGAMYPYDFLDAVGEIASKALQLVNPLDVLSINAITKALHPDLNSGLDNEDLSMVLIGSIVCSVINDWLTECDADSKENLILRLNHKVSYV